MLEILILVFTGRYFYKFSKENGLVPALWAVLAVVSYFVGAFTVGIIIALLAPEVLDNTLMITLIGLPAGALGILACYFIMKGQAKSKKKVNDDTEVLDVDLHL